MPILRLARLGAVLGAGFLLAATALALPAQRTRQSLPPDTVRGPRGEALGTQTDFDLAVGGGFTNPFGPQASVRVLPAHVYEVTLQNTGTGWQETFLVGVPQVPLVPMAPLLVAFHGYGRSARELIHETTYFQRAMARGWYVIAPLGAHKFNFGVPYAQENIRVVLHWAETYLNVDRERMYGVGFSMGGGGVACYAARHLDPQELMFAAIVDHTGTVSIRHEYHNSSNTSLFENPLMFGGSPAAQPFAYQQASTIDLDPGSGAVDQASDLVRNLRHVPVKVWAVQGDPLAYLVYQSQRFHEQALVRGVSSLLTLAPGSQHDWSTLNEEAVLDYFEPLRLSLPAPGDTTRILADRNARFLHFTVTQAVAGAFSPFRWNVNTALNRLIADQIGNISSLRFHPADLGLDAGAELQIVVGTLDGGGLDVVLDGFAQPPVSVLRNGQLTNAWTYDAGAGRLTLHEASAASYPGWSVQP